MTAATPVLRVAPPVAESPDGALVAAIARAERAEFQARTNAETIASMRRTHRAEMEEVHRKLRAAVKPNAEYDDLLQRSVVTLSNGDAVTLHQLYEDARTETFSMTHALCEKCRDPKCAFPGDCR